MTLSAPRPAPWRIYLGLLGSPVLVVLLVAVLAMGAVNVLGAVRAYMAGESLWSKARAEAVQHLLRYTESHDDTDMARFRQALHVPENDRLAREAMERHDPHTSAIRSWLIEGGNHPDDVGSMIRLFRWFGDQWVLRDARATWAEGDRQIERLKQEAERLQQAVHAQAPPEQINTLVHNITRVNQDLNNAGLRFSDVLGHAARVTEVLLTVGIASIAMLLTLVSVLQVRSVLIKQTRHQQALDQYHRRWELASTAAGFGLYELDKATDTIQLDGKAASLHGLGHEFIVVPRSRIRNLIIAEDAPRTRRDADQALQGGDDYKIIYRVRHPDGTIRALEATGRLVRSEEDQRERLMGVLRDVTEELSQAETAMKRDAAERVAQTQREFLSRLSHELRTPLNAILGFAQLMQMDRSGSSPTQMRQADMILGAGKQLLALVEDVLDLSKVESGHIHMNLQRVDAVQAIKTCTALIGSHLHRYNLTLIEQLPDHALWVIADPQRLHQVLINLLTNACKYNCTGGLVTVRAQVDDAQPSHVVIDIGDTGHGLSTDEQAELFQPFKRVNPSPQVEGTGLGLYIVKQLIERMQGQVRVHSERGHGSHFYVMLQTAPEPLAEADATADSQALV